MFIQKKLTKALGIALMAALSMSIFLPATATEKEVKIKMNVPVGCGEVAQHAILGFLLGVADGAVRTFTSAYLNQILFSKLLGEELLGKTLGAAGAGILTHSCFEFTQRMLMAPKATAYNTAYYTGLIPTTIALTPELARHKETIKATGDSIKQTSITIAKGIFNWFAKGVDKLNSLVNKSDKKEVAKVATKAATTVAQSKKEVAQIAVKKIAKIVAKTVTTVTQSKTV